MTEDLYRAIYDVAKVLEVPVVILALLSLAVIIVELGRFGAEWTARRVRRSADRNTTALTRAAIAARRALTAGDTDGVARALRSVGRSDAMDTTIGSIAAAAGDPDGETRIAKDLADFDFGSQRRLARTRLLVRVGPALGLMGTLIPLAPALDGLAKGDVTTLTDNLRVAFSVTVLGLLVGAVAFGISLVRDRFYGEDYSDLEYIAAVLTGENVTERHEPAEAEGVAP